MADQHIDSVIALMDGFAERTGLTSGANPARYLWTDAFAVCNYLGLARQADDDQYLKLALRLVDQVHQVLGRFRDDDPRSGWLSGLDDADAERHPTVGGLRIGKPLPERGPDEALDERLEWDRDGQYFHYLAKWMHALDQVSRATGDTRYNLWARELAHTASHAFVYAPTADGLPPRMVWKMSTDLKRALVPSMGQHDPLDGYITCLQLRATMNSLGQTDAGPSLKAETSIFSAMLKWSEGETTDPLGLGGLMSDAWRLLQLEQQHAESDIALLDRLLTATGNGLEPFARSGELQQPASYRLAFRELGLAIGLHAVARMADTADDRLQAGSIRRHVDALMHYQSLASDIETFWQNPGNHRIATWTDHRDINEVMLATSLAPAGFLDIKPL